MEWFCTEMNLLMITVFLSRYFFRGSRSMRDPDDVLTKLERGNEMEPNVFIKMNIMWNYIDILFLIPFVQGMVKKYTTSI